MVNYVVVHQGDVVVPPPSHPTVVLARNRVCLSTMWASIHKSQHMMIQPEKLNIPTLSLYDGKGKKFSLTSKNSLGRFQGGDVIFGYS